MGEMGLGQAEQHFTLSLHMYNCLYSTVYLPGASLASIEVLLTISQNCGRPEIEDGQINRQIDRYTAVFKEILPPLKACSGSPTELHQGTHALTSEQLLIKTV